MADDPSFSRRPLPPVDPVAPDRRLTFHGRRHGRPLRHARREALTEDLGPYGLTVPSHDGSLDLPALAPGYSERWLEVGIGNGEHLLAQAEAHPDTLLMGCEPFIPGVAKCLADRRVRGLENVRVWPDDARLLMDALPDAALDRAFVLYPDPWPKRRHWGRRFIQQASLDRLARTLKPGAELRLVTDFPPLADWMLWQTRAHPAFQWLARKAEDWRVPPVDWVETRYQSKTTAQGRDPIFLLFRRR